ncbi:MAG: Ig-like domain-containing protein [bacterium]|nr:Ig-like domain-containing protein [bacterium]
MNKFLITGVLSVILTTGGAFTAHAAAVLPTLPQKQVDVTLPTVNGSTLNATCSTLQAQLNAAAALDVNLTHQIILATGTTCTGPYKLPSHTGGTGWILIKGPNYASLPASGTRVSPSDAALMPIVMYGDDGNAYTGAFSAQTGAQRYRIVGINVVHNPAFSPNWALIVTGYNNQDALNTGYIILDRVLLRDTDMNHLTYRGIYGDAEVGNTALIDSYVSGIKGGTPGNGRDTQGWASVNNPGPILIQNNFIEAAGENIMFCGGGTRSDATMPRDATIRLNTISKNPNWWGEPTVPAGLTVKTLLELKCGQRVLIDSNDFLDMPWNDGGNAFRLTVRADGVTSNDVSDITITNNLGKNVQNWINSFASDDGTVTTKHGKRWNVANNLVYGLGWSCMPGNGCDGHFFTIQNGGGTSNCTDPTPTCQHEDITISHNTVDDVGSNIMQIQMPGAVGLNFKDNLINSNGSYGIFGGGGTGITVFGTNLFNYGWPGPTWTFANNRIAGIGGNSLDSSAYPQGTNSYPADVSSFLFTNRAARDYTLQSGSPAKGAASDGTDQGVNFAAYNAARSGGTPPPAPTPDTSAPSVPSGLSATSISSTQINLSWTAATDNVGVSGYRIYRNGTQIATSAGTTYSNTALTASTAYSYTVSAYDASNNTSAQSASASASTQAPPVVATTPTSSTSSWSKGFNFRATGGFVTDGTNETYSIGAAYPETRNGVTFGWSSKAPSFDVRDRSTAPDRRLAGLNFTDDSGTQSVFRVDLPSAGTYTINLALGDYSYSDGYSYAQILDNTTVLATMDAATGPTYSTYNDATGVNRTAANWPSQNVSITKTFASTVLYIKIGTPTNVSSSSYTTIAHLFISQVPAATPTPDTTAPSVSLTTPAALTTVSGAAVTVSATASDNTGVSGVQFLLDGIALATEDTTSPYTVTWNTTTATNASHTLSARARDAAGNQTTSATVTVTVANITAPTPDTSTPSTPTSLSATAVSTTQINLSWSAATDNVAVSGYRIYRNGTLLTTTTATSYANTGLSASTAYAYTIAAYDAAGNMSAQSSGASATTQAAVVTPPATPATPSTPATSNTPTSTNTNTPNTTSPAGGSSGSFSSTATTPATSSTYTPPSSQTTPVTPTLSLTRTLYQGTKGTDVKNLQTFLISSGYLAPANTTGFYGPLTREAVQKYQCAQSIVCSGTQTSTGYGMVGLKTRAKLNGSSSSYVSTSTLTPAQADAIIALIQSFGADAAVVARVKVVLGR